MADVDWLGVLAIGLSLGAGFLGLGLAGPVGFLVGLGLGLFVGFAMREARAAREQRLADLEERVSDLEAEVEE